jgi:hypothetical protein
MSDSGEGGGKFRFAVRNELRDLFLAQSPVIQKTIKDMMFRAVTDPVAARVIFSEGQSLMTGTVKEGDKLFFLRFRFVYDPATHLIVLADMATPMLIDGMH